MVGTIVLVTVALVIIASGNGIVNTGNCQVRRSLHLLGREHLAGGDR